MGYQDSKYTVHAFMVEVLYDDPFQGPIWLMTGQGDEVFTSVDTALEYAKASLNQDTTKFTKARVVRMTTVTETTFTPEPGAVVEAVNTPGYGTSGGVELTDEVIERVAEEAEQGYPTDRLRPRGAPPTSLLVGRIILVSYIHVR